MRKKIKIGIPRAFLYYRYNILWKNFFEMLGCNIILSPETNKDIVEIGKKYSIDESCLASKIYMGHVYSLIDKCDYILIPRVADYGKKDKVCVKFNGIYDVVKNTFPLANILDYNLEFTKWYNEFFAFLKIGFKVNKNIFKILISYFKAKRKERQYNVSLMNSQKKILRNNNLKILIVAHPYNIYDKYIGENIINFFKHEEVDVLFADRLERKIAISYAKDLSNTLYWKYSKELIGAISYYKEAVDGIIFVTAFPCGPDSLVNELILRKIKNIPITNIIIDESTAEAGLETRLESFLDIIKSRCNNE